MKTKLKTLSNSQKESILKNRNFLNNQNYILGNRTKENLLKKVEYKSKYRNNYINKIVIEYPYIVDLY
jgi:hypothetical protein